MLKPSMDERKGRGDLGKVQSRPPGREGLRGNPGDEEASKEERISQEVRDSNAFSSPGGREGVSGAAAKRGESRGRLPESSRRQKNSRGKKAGKRHGGLQLGNREEGRSARKRGSAINSAQEERPVESPSEKPGAGAKLHLERHRTWGRGVKRNKARQLQHRRARQVLEGTIWPKRATSRCDSEGKRPRPGEFSKKIQRSRKDEDREPEWLFAVGDPKGRDPDVEGKEGLRQ